jgi:hypothetical protein
MAWVERFTCDVCGKLMGEPEGWWVAADECDSPSGQGPSQPVLRLMRWDNFAGHAAGSKHLCGAVCMHTFLDRWMTGSRAGTDNCEK